MKIFRFQNRYAIKAILIGIIIITTAAIVYYSASNQTKAIKQAETENLPQALSNRHHMKNVNYAMIIGHSKIQIQVELMFIKKQKLIGLSFALAKKMVLRGVTITIFQKNQKILKLYKYHIQSPVSLNKISIDEPDILFPESIKHPKKIVIDKTQKRILFQYENEIKTWDLGNPPF